MRDDIADIVHSIIRRGLSLRDRLEVGEVITREAERAAFTELLAPLETEEIWDAGEDEDLELDFSGLDNQEERERLGQATIRYALTCWLDEFLLQYSAWGEGWGERTLEFVLYGNRRRGEKFWEEARYAEIRGDVDALEVLYWCVMLGYRGVWRDKPERIEAWVERVGALLDKPAAHAEEETLEWAPLVPETTAASDLPYRRMLFTTFLTVSVLVPLGLLIYWRHGGV